MHNKWMRIKFPALAEVKGRPWFYVKGSVVSIEQRSREPHRPLMVAAMLCCRSWEWGNDYESRTRGPSVAHKKAPLQLIQRFIDVDLDAWTVRWTFGGDPANLWRRARLISSGELYVENDTFRNYSLHFNEVIKETKEELRKRREVIGRMPHATKVNRLALEPNARG